MRRRWFTDAGGCGSKESGGTQMLLICMDGGSLLKAFALRIGEGEGKKRFYIFLLGNRKEIPWELNDNVLPLNSCISKFTSKTDRFNNQYSSLFFYKKKF